MIFVEVILPLPLYSTFTYSVPDDITEKISIGSRVLVQFGRKKYYTGLIAATHNTPPAGYEVKPIMALLDSKPILRHGQIQLWTWIAEYYLCSVGEVFKAAIPTGLKPESETTVTLNENYEYDAEVRISERKAEVISMLRRNGKMTLRAISDALEIKEAAPIVNTMLNDGLVVVNEKIVEKYHSKKRTMVRLEVERNDHEALHEILDTSAKTDKRQKLLLGYLQLSDWLHPQKPLKGVERSELLSITGVSPAVYRAMIAKGLFSEYKEYINRFEGLKSDDDQPITVAALSYAQEKARIEIKEQFRKFDTVLLHGVTGSGKTEIYTHLIKEVLEAGHQVLYLVPEISLTTQLTDRLRRVFGNRLLVYHSKFSDSERVDLYRRVLESSEPMVILGARSAVFLPFSHIGLVIVDEEHESSFKQYDPAPRYNARDTAIMLAHNNGAKTLLGSATPSVETFFKATNNKYGLVTLSERFSGASLPEVKVVDMRDARKRKNVTGILSSCMEENLSDTLKAGNQAIIFQNRRGFAPLVVCKTCGWTPKCRNCDVSLVYHKNSNMLRCHYCGYTEMLPKLCPACGENTIQTFGYGTERIAEDIHKQFPDYRVSRMDLDTTRNKDSYQEIIEEFARHETDILVGTQMVSKGLDFDNVKIVGVLNADTLLNYPDFRSNERAFNMLEQVAGRAGRKGEAGSVIIQTSNPDSEIIGFVRNHDYMGFYNYEIEERKKYSYPPFSRIINIYLKNKDAAACDYGAVLMAKALRNVFGERVLGPEKPFVSRISTFYIQQIMLKIEAGASMKKVKQLLRQTYASIAEEPRIKSSIIYYDVDPS